MRPPPPAGTLAAMNPQSPCPAGAGLNEDGIVALFTSALRDFYERRGGSDGRSGAAGGETEDVA